MSSKQEKLTAVRQKMQALAEFLVDYLPLANAHNSDFFIHKHWDYLIHPDVGKELLALDDTKLAILPSGKLYISHSTNPSSSSSTEVKAIEENLETANLKEGQESASNILKSNKKLMICKFHRQKSRALKPKWDKCLKPHWKSQSLKDFVTEVQKHTLNELSVLEEVSDVMINFRMNDIISDKVTITNFMSNKKSYEVDVMADVCAVLSKHFKINKVIDIGSGRGYLGCQLSLMHGLQVLGIDSSTTNTHSAKTRLQRLEKHWNGLVRNAKEDKERGFKLRRGKNFRGKQRKKALKSELVPNEGTNESPTAFTETELEVEVNLESIFNEKVNLPDEFSNEIESKHKVNSSTLDSLVIYQTEPKVRRPRVSSSDNREDEVLFSRSKQSSYSDKDDVFNEEQQKNSLSLGLQEKSPSGQPEASTLYVPITHYVTDDTDLLELVKFHFPASIESGEHFMLTGLHTCGNLAASILQLFVANSAVHVLCNVGCCYHLLEEEYIRNPYLEDGEPDYEEVGFPLSSPMRHQLCQLGRNARMLASQAPDRAASTNKLPGQSLFWRAVLQVILHDLTGDTREDWQVGKIAAKCQDFVAYVRKALTKLEINHTLTDEVIKGYELAHSKDFRKIQAFVQLRAVLAPCIESLLLLDRFYYLLEQENIQDVHLIQLFDPVKSPRCYAIVAIKKENHENV